MSNIYKLPWLKYLLLSLFVYALIYPLFNQGKFNRQQQVSDDDTKYSDEAEEIPLHNVNLPNFSQFNDVKQKKREFFQFINPAIEAENQQIANERKQVVAILEKLQLSTPLTADDNQFVSRLVKRYKVSKKLSPIQKLEALANRVDVIPNELVLVQAANESAWGTSRFARVGLNFFGIWCYKKGCGMVPNSRDHGLKHEVAAFKSVEQAVSTYLHNINTNDAYRVFRTIRAQLRQQNKPLSAQILATGLLPYSERGTDYVLEISDMIRHNQRYFDQLQSE